MPRETQFNAGSVIYFQGDEAESVFLLRQGGVNLSYLDIETGEDQHDAVELGEFFGVGSALGRYRREENAAATLQSTVVVYSVAEFERMAMDNSRIMMTMLRVFSRQLRRMHKKVEDLTDSGEKNAEDGLFHLGEFYLANRHYAQAVYVFGRYLTYYPVGKYAERALKLQERAESQSRHWEAAEAVLSSSSTSAAYYDALSLMIQKKIPEARVAFKKIADSGADDEYTQKSCFDLGRCIFLEEKYTECIRFYTKMLLKYPKHPSMAEVLYYIGQCHERQDRAGQAAGFYRKALELVQTEDNGLRGKFRQALDRISEDY